MTTSNFRVKRGIYVGDSAIIRGVLVASGLNYPTTDGNSNDVIKTDGSGNLTFGKVLDSADVISFIDSDYIQARQTTSSDGANLTISETAPSPSSPGDIWLDPTNFALLVRYQDSDDDLQWVQVNGLSGLSATSGIDSAATIALIDSDYIQSRQITGGGASLTISETAPSPSSAGDMWLDPTNFSFLVRYQDSDDDLQWVQVNGLSGSTVEAQAFDSAAAIALIDSDYIQLRQSNTGSGANLTISTLPPSSPSTGDMWLDPTNFALLVRYQDSDDDLQWVQVNGLSGGASSSVDSATVVSIVDSDYVQARQTTSSGANLTISENAPSPSLAGDIWLDPTNFALLVRYEDSDNDLQWVQVNGLSGSTGSTLDSADVISLIDSDYVQLRQKSNLTTSTLPPSSPVPGDIWLDPTNFALLVRYEDSDNDIQWVQVNGLSGSSSSTKYETIDQSGTLTVNTGTYRWYAQESITITKIVARVDSAPTGSSINIRINKNGSQAVTMSIASDSIKSTNSSPSLTMIEDDYLTIDVTQIGSVNAGENLKVTLTYQ